MPSSPSGHTRRRADYGRGVTTTTPDLAAFDLALDDVAQATDRLLATVDGFSDADVRASSGLPDWTRAHVLTHIARNADAMARLTHYARTGEEQAMYPGGPPARNAAISDTSDSMCIFVILLFLVVRPVHMIPIRSWPPARRCCRR